jgi:hypothetical protein
LWIDELFPDAEQLSQAIAMETEKFNKMSQSNQSTIANLEEKLHQLQLVSLHKKIHLIGSTY